ncbi:UNVERIFIED_CONTAM: LuxR family two component transcriptional regulator [Acetivibrio alkalicellulosi]
MINVLIVDDQTIIRDSLKYIIEQDNEIKVVACANNGKHALKLCDKFKPDIVLMDIMMPICDGVEGTRLIKSKYSKIKVLILTTFNDDDNISKALLHGADGYILKDVQPHELIISIKSVALGMSILQKNILTNIATKISKTEYIKNTNNNHLISNLTKRELEVIKLLVDGKNNKSISVELKITEGSVRNIISSILDKLEFEDRTQLAIFAVKNRIV